MRNSTELVCAHHKWLNTSQVNNSFANICSLPSVWIKSGKSTASIFTLWKSCPNEVASLKNVRKTFYSYACIKNDIDDGHANKLRFFVLVFYILMPSSWLNVNAVYNSHQQQEMWIKKNLRRHITDRKE